ncbi:MAG: glycosyltransferase family 2 protein [Gemmatimonadaceae bacterium]
MRRAPHCACVILSAAFFERGGSLDTSIPMFAEELTLAAEAVRLRLPVRYVPTLGVLHREHSTTGAHLTREKYEMERAARRLYYSITAR